jgi:thiol-disulfide isomerase/thioredoxin
MKVVKFAFLALFVMMSASLYAQSNSKVIAVVNKADWCSTCQKNGERVMTEVLAHYKEPQLSIVANDLTNETTTAESKASLEKLGVYELVANEKKTGQIILIDSKTKKVISTISVAKSTEALKQAFDSAIQQP